MPITKKTWTVPSADRVEEILREAFRVAQTPRKGPVQVNLPRDVLSAQTARTERRDPGRYRNHSVPAGDDVGVPSPPA